jgi:hypothetical protein
LEKKEMERNSSFGSLQESEFVLLILSPSPPSRALRGNTNDKRDVDNPDFEYFQRHGGAHAGDL